MTLFCYEDIKSLSIPLPEDIQKKKLYGDFCGAKRLIDIRLKLDIPIILRKRLELEKIILHTLAKEYTITFGEAFRMIKENIPDFTKEELLRYQDEGEIDWMYIDGEVRYFRRFLNTLRKVNNDFTGRFNILDKTENKKGCLSINLEKLEEKECLSNNLEILEEKAKQEVIARLIDKKELVYHLKIRASLKIKEEAFVSGTVKVHLPIPTKSNQISNVRIRKVEPKGTYIANEEQEQRTIYIEKDIDENVAFTIEYEYDNKVSYVKLDEFTVETTDQPKFILREQAPHIRFTPYLISLTKEIIGDEKNVLIKARKIYDYITTKIQYAYMREYISIDNLSEYAALNGKGDCGVQSLLFITLCRIANIPASWQSGLYTTPYSAGSHDWAQFYIAPYGWLFADCSFGGSAYKNGDYASWDFYFGNIDPFRMPANSDFQQEFDPPKKYMRADPYDNQRGEIEYEHRGLCYDEFDSMKEVIECYEIFSK